MKAIYVQDGLSVTFPGRDEEFDEGVEIGIAVALMAAGHDFTMWMSDAALEQAEALAEKMNFHLVIRRAPEGNAQVAFRVGRPRPTLVLVATLSEPRLRTGGS
jgi:hypothetical protein